MNPSINSLARAARFKAAGSIAALMLLGLLASLLMAGLAQTGKGSSDPTPSEKGGNPLPKMGLAQTEAAPDAETIADSVSVQIVAPKLVAPPAEKAPPAQKSTAQTENETRDLPPPPPPPLREINIVAESPSDERPPPSRLDEDPLAKTPDQESKSKTNAEPLISVKCIYDFVAVQKSLQAGRGELVALCRRPGARDTLMLISRPAGGNYQLRGNRASDNLANLGLRLHATDGDLADLERRIRNQVGMETVVFYFAPSADFARSIIATQQSALESFRRSHQTAATEAVVLNGRFSCAADGTPIYTIIGVSLADGGSASQGSVNEQIDLGKPQARLSTNR